jgi:predicted NAD-dependent protein-ADP-ribosyltransferase YbiA (DUF1768 family)
MANLSAYQYGTLPSALETYVLQTGDANYQNLFSPKTGYLKCQGANKVWAVTRAAPKDRAAMIDLMDGVREGLQGMKIADIPNAGDLVRRVNQVYCEVVFPRGEIPVKGGVVGFNSRCKDVTRILSNFFGTLLIFTDPTTGEKIIYPSSEAAYQAHKVLRLEIEERLPSSAVSSPSPLHLEPSVSSPGTPLKLERHNSAPHAPKLQLPPVAVESAVEPFLSLPPVISRKMKPQRLFSPESEKPSSHGPVRGPVLSVLVSAPGAAKRVVDDTEEKGSPIPVTPPPPATEEFTKKSSPLRVKKLGNSPQIRGQQKPSLTNEMALAKSKLMQEIIQAKLDFNHYVAERLKGTNDAFLVEETGKDSFWGGDPQDRSLRKQKFPITKASQNVLGTILMAARANLK